MCFYNLALKYLPSVPYKDLSVREKRKICHSNDVNIPDDGLMVFEGVLLPSSYCLIDEAEKFFRDAVKERMKRRFNVELDADKEIFSLIYFFHRRG